jgi:hypothetical protein
MKTSDQLVLHDKFNGTLKFGPNVLAVVATLARVYPGIAPALSAVQLGDGTPTYNIQNFNLAFITAQ